MSQTNTVSMHWSTNKEVQDYRAALQKKRRVESFTLLKTAASEVRLSETSQDYDNGYKPALGRSQSEHTFANHGYNEIYTFEWLGIYDIDKEYLVDIFGNINFVIICGSANRAEHIANLVYKLFDRYRNNSKRSHLLSYDKIGQSQFYSLFRIENILICSHGMGFNSVGICLNELIRILKISKIDKYGENSWNKTFQVLRMGSCGGLGVDAGTIIISKNSVNYHTLKPEWNINSCGIKKSIETYFSENMIDKLYQIGLDLNIKRQISKFIKKTKESRIINQNQNRNSQSQNQNQNQNRSQFTNYTDTSNASINSINIDRNFSKFPNKTTEKQQRKKQTQNKNINDRHLARNESESSQLSREEIKIDERYDEFDICNLSIPVTIGSTLACEDFYEGQGRIDGAACDYTESNKFEFLEKLQSIGVKNIEMEGSVVAGICNSNKIESVMMCVAYLNRIKGDSVSKEYTKQELKSWMDRAISIVLNYIKLHKMNS